MVKPSKETQGIILISKGWYNGGHIGDLYKSRKEAIVAYIAEITGSELKYIKNNNRAIFYWIKKAYVEVFDKPYMIEELLSNIIKAMSIDKVKEEFSISFNEILEVIISELSLLQIYDTDKKEDIIYLSDITNGATWEEMKEMELMIV